MAEMTIRLQNDPVTGRKNIIVSLKSNEDSLPHEHEQAHRALVEKLIEGGIITATEVGKVVVEREAATETSETQQSEKQQTQRESHTEGI